MTEGPFADWAVSKRAHDALECVARVLARRTDAFDLDSPGVHASGLAVLARSEALLGKNVTPMREGAVTVATDAAGLVIAVIEFPTYNPPRTQTVLTLNGLRDEIFLPLLRAAASVLDEAEAYGRILLELRIGRLQNALTLSDLGGERDVPTRLPLGAEISLPLDPNGGELELVADTWRSDAGRAAGYVTLRP